MQDDSLYQPEIKSVNFNDDNSNIMEEALNEYEAEKAYFIYQSQVRAWDMWIIRFINMGMDINLAVEKTRAIVLEWTGQVCTFNYNDDEEKLF